MNKKQKKVLIRIIVAAVLMLVFLLIPVTGWIRLALFMIPYLVIGYDILKKAFKGKSMALWYPKWKITAFLSRFIGRNLVASYTYKYNKRPHINEKKV